MSVTSALKKPLRRVPGLYRLAQRAYYGGLYASEKVVGSRLHAWIWRFARPVSAEAVDGWAKHPHRPLVVDAIARFEPIGHVLEVGCSAGMNLLLLSRRWPAARLVGIDVSEQALGVGQEWLRASGAGHVDLRLGAAQQLGEFADGAFDVVFTDASLIYLGPDVIERALREMVRVAARGLVIHEWSLTEPDSRTHFWYDLHWVHNYPRLLRAIDPALSIETSRLPSEVWNTGGWAEYGTILMVRKP